MQETRVKGGRLSYYSPNSRVRNKKDALKIHAKKRAKRFNLELTNEVKTKIIKLIRNNNSIVIESKSTNNRKAHLVIFDTKLMVVIYDKARKEIVTFIKPTPQQVELANQNMDRLLGYAQTMQ